MRLDKFLKISRIIKRRTVANEIASNGRIEVNGRPAKPGTRISEGDIIEIHFGTGLTKVRVLHVAENIRKSDAGSLFEILDNGPDPDVTDLFQKD